MSHTAASENTMSGIHMVLPRLHSTRLSSSLLVKASVMICISKLSTPSIDSFRSLTTCHPSPPALETVNCVHRTRLWRQNEWLCRCLYILPSLVFQLYSSLVSSPSNPVHFYFYFHFYFHRKRCHAFDFEKHLPEC